MKRDAHNKVQCKTEETLSHLASWDFAVLRPGERDSTHLIGLYDISSPICVAFKGGRVIDGARPVLEARFYYAARK